MSTSRLPSRGGPIIARSKSSTDRPPVEEESIYATPSAPSFGASPVIKTYNIQPTKPPVPTAGAAPSPTGAARPKMHVDSSQVQNIFNPIHGPRDAQRRAGIKPPDHARSNLRSIKEQSSLNQLRKQQAQEEEARAAQTRNAAGFVRSTSMTAPKRTNLPSQAPTTYNHYQQHQQQTDVTNGRDFVRGNKLGAVAPVRQPRAAPEADDGAKYLQKPDFGRVPTYLLERKIELLEQQDAQIRAREAAMVPAGMRMLPEEERLDTLAALQRNRAELERALQGLPLRIETHAQIRWRDDLERRMKEVEEGIKIFSRAKVLVQA